jgi:hypothetical protein
MLNWERLTNIVGEDTAYFVDWDDGGLDLPIGG